MNNQQSYRISIEPDVRRSCLDCQADIQLFRLSLTIAVDKTKPIAIGKGGLRAKT